jgi:Cu-Zn family superoxide dismutase
VVHQIRLLGMLFLASFLGSCAEAADKAVATLKDGSGKELGKAEFTDTASGVLIRLDLISMPPGEHAFHVHAIGKCDPPDFKSAGAHFNPHEAKHGFMNEKGPHAGDMPNLHVPESGKLVIEMLNPFVSLREDRALLDQDGSALIIHAGVDDYLTDPAGNAGDRIACGVVMQ